MINKRFSAAFAVILFAGALSFLAAANNKTQTWKGYVTDTWCGLDREAKAPTVACTTSTSIPIPTCCGRCAAVAGATSASSRG